MSSPVRIALAAIICVAASIFASRVAAAAEPQSIAAHPSADRLILVTVADSLRSLQGRPGSTPRGYDAMQGYTGTSAARAVARSIAKDFHLTQIDAWPIALLSVHCVVFQIPDNSARDTVLQVLRAEPRVRLAEPMATFATRSQTYNDPYIGLQTGFRQLDVADAHGLSQGEGIKVAIIDTGIDSRHPDLEHRVVTSRNYVDNNDAQFREDRHGTEIAGVIAATANNGLGIAGVAPGVRLIALKACWQLTAGSDSARCNSFTLAKALTAAIDLKPQIVNLSLGGPADPLLTMLVEAGLRRGVIFVGAAAESAGGFPEGVPGVIAVAASEGRSAAEHELRAPGREILTLQPQGHYDFASGSSLAVAHVSGTIALVLAHYPHLDAQKLFDLLDRTSTPLFADSAAHSINACAALASLSNAPDTGCYSQDHAHTAGAIAQPKL